MAGPLPALADASGGPKVEGYLFKIPRSTHQSGRGGSVIPPDGRAFLAASTCSAEWELGGPDLAGRGCARDAYLVRLAGSFNTRGGRCSGTSHFTSLSTTCLTEGMTDRRAEG